MNNAPIGIFDSGLGGLSIWVEIRKRLPNESLVYYGDGKNCPYGRRSAEEITGYAIDAVECLLQKGVKLIVVACNTATGAAIKTLRQRYSIPIVGMEPAVKPAALATRSKVIGILATKRSLESELYLHTSSNYASDVKILQSEGVGFVELVESGKCNSELAQQTISRVIEPMLQQGADQIVLGCTHYPFLKKDISEVIGNRNVNIIDPSPAIADRVIHLLNDNNLRCADTHIAEYEFASAADVDYNKRIKDFAEGIWLEHIHSLKF